MERAPRSELLQIIQQKDETLSKYKTKLKDLVSAYKSLDKEKTALEASVKVLTSSKERKSARPDDEAGTSQSESEEAEPVAKSDSNEAESAASHDAQLATLSESLATLTEEHAKLKASYVADKKQLKQEYIDLQNSAEQRESKLQAQVESLEAAQAEARARLVQEQSNREQEHSDQAALMHELQKLLNAERVQKEFFEDKVDALQREMNQLKKQQSSDDAEKYRKQIQDLRNELQAVRNRLQSAETAARTPDPQIARLQHEIAEMKAHYRDSVSEERRRANAAESQASHMAQGGEERISALEARLAELSEVVGSYERLRAQDQQAMAKLKERITHLDLENSALAQMARSPEAELLEEADVEAVVSRIRKLQEVLSRSGEHHRLKDLLEEFEGLSTDAPGLHSRCREELEALKEEFERYKLRASAVLKSRSGKDSQVAELQSAREALQQCADSSRQQLQQAEAERVRLQSDSEALRAQLAKTQMELRQSIEREEHARGQLNALDAEMARVRQRSTALLAEKEQEASALRMRLGHVRQQSTGVEGPNQSQVLSTDCESEKAARELLSRDNSESGLLHYETELARMRQELSTLRLKKRELDARLREIETEANDERRKLTEQLALCKQELRRAERARAEDGCGIEYIKNVVLQYMLCADAEGKERIANVIGTVLEFSTTERTEVATFNKSWWAAHKFHSTRR